MATISNTIKVYPDTIDEKELNYWMRNQENEDERKGDFYMHEKLNPFRNCTKMWARQELTNLGIDHNIKSRKAELLNMLLDINPHKYLGCIYKKSELKRLCEGNRLETKGTIAALINRLSSADNPFLYLEDNESRSDYNVAVDRRLRPTLPTQKKDIVKKRQDAWREVMRRHEEDEIAPESSIHRTPPRTITPAPSIHRTPPRTITPAPSIHRTPPRAITPVPSIHRTPPRAIPSREEKEQYEEQYGPYEGDEFYEEQYGPFLEHEYYDQQHEEQYGPFLEHEYYDEQYGPYDENEYYEEQYGPYDDNEYYDEQYDQYDEGPVDPYELFLSGDRRAEWMRREDSQAMIDGYHFHELYNRHKSCTKEWMRKELTNHGVAITDAMSKQTLGHMLMNINKRQYFACTYTLSQLRELAVENELSGLGTKKEVIDSIVRKPYPRLVLGETIVERWKPWMTTALPGTRRADYERRLAVIDDLDNRLLNREIEEQKEREGEELEQWEDAHQEAPPEPRDEFEDDYYEQPAANMYPGRLAELVEEYPDTDEGDYDDYGRFAGDPRFFVDRDSYGYYNQPPQNQVAQIFADRPGYVSHVADIGSEQATRNEIAMQATRRQRHTDADYDDIIEEDKDISARKPEDIIQDTKRYPKNYWKTAEAPEAVYKGYNFHELTNPHAPCSFKWMKHELKELGIEISGRKTKEKMGEALMKVSNSKYFACRYDSHTLAELAKINNTFPRIGAASRVVGSILAKNNPIYAVQEEERVSGQRPLKTAMPYENHRERDARAKAQLEFRGLIDPEYRLGGKELQPDFGYDFTEIPEYLEGGPECELCGKAVLPETAAEEQKCGHIFHYECISQFPGIWETYKCPVCKKLAYPTRYVPTPSGPESIRRRRNIEAENECAICKTPLTVKGTVKIKCGHKFHKVCLAKWMLGSHHKTCPSCRQDVKWTPLV